MSNDNLPRMLLACSLVLILAAGCAPGDARWSTDAGHPANFWAGLWHGLIIVVTFIVSLFTRDVKIYEVNNVGWGYNLGFLLGAMISLGGGARSATHRKAKKRDWDEIGDRVAARVRAQFDDELKREEPDWDEFSRQVEARIRDEFKGWKD
jgi:hypothetical protein